MSRITRLAAVLATGIPFVVGCASVEHHNVTFDVSPNGEHIVFSSADGDLYLLDLKTLEVRQLTETDAVEATPSFSPDGTKVAYAAYESGATSSFIFTRSLDGKQVRQLTKTPGVSDSGPSFSGDGSRITFARAHRYRRYSMGGWTWDDWDVYVMDVDGTQLRRITRQKYRSLRTPRFSRDGKTVLYSTFQTIFEADVGGDSPPRSLTKERPEGDRHGAWASQPAVSPDGGRVAFISDRFDPFQYDVLIMDRDGTSPRPLGVTSVSRYNQSPVFMPDGKTVMFLAGTDWNAGSRAIYSLWEVTIEGQNPRRVADSGLFTTPRSWKPSP